MAKHATLKDILYALQFNGEHLLFTLPEPPKRRSRWWLSKTKTEVLPEVAEKFRSHPACVEIAKNEYAWREAA